MIQKIIDKLKNDDSWFAKTVFKLLLFVYEKILGSYIIQNIYDSVRFICFSGIYNRKRKNVLDSKLIKEYHRLEKGLSFKKFRPFFGKKVIDRLLLLIYTQLKSSGVTNTAQIATHTIKQYIELHHTLGYKNLYIQKIKENYNLLVERHPKLIEGSNSGGFYLKQRSNLSGESYIDADNFFSSRYTVRDFSDKVVSIEKIKKALSLARKTPSVCNRQSWRTYILTEREIIDKALQYQNGNRGFGDKANKLLIITSDLQTFHGGTERYQQRIDGGMFAMTVVRTLHAVGLGGCCLNWSALFYNDIRLRKIIPIKKEESIIMLIAVGHIPDKLKVSQSPRKPLDEIITIL